ncbi:MAG: DUF6796 family protein [Pseudomonadota bacterium]
MTPETALFVCALGVLGVLGSATVMITDWIGWTRPLSAEGKAFDMSGVEGAWVSYLETSGVGISRQRRYWASIVGGLALLPCSLGFVTVFVGLLPAGIWWAGITALLLGGMMVYGVVSHTLFGVLNEINHARDKLPAQGEQREVVNDFFSTALAIWTPFPTAVLAMQFLGSCLFSYLVFIGESIFPVWMCLVNHFVLGLVLALSKRYTPFSVYRWLMPPSMHMLNTVPLLSLCTYYVWSSFVA